MIMMKQYPQRRDHLRSPWMPRLAVGTPLAILGLTAALFIQQDAKQTRPPLDLEAKPTVAAGAEYWNAYSNCTISNPRFEGVEKGVAHIALQINATHNPAVKQAAEAGKVHYLPSPRALNPETGEERQIIAPPLVDGPNENASLTIPLSLLADGYESVDVSVEATDNGAAGTKMGVRQFCGRIGITGTTDNVEYVEPDKRDSGMTDRERFTPQQ